MALGRPGDLHPNEVLAGQLRVGISTATEVFGVPMERPCVEAVRSAGRLLQDFGHIVEEFPLPCAEWEVLRTSWMLAHQAKLT